MTAIDIIDHLVGIAPGSALDAARARRPTARSQAQASYDALFTPADFGGVPLQDRLAIACFVAGLHQRPDILAHYAIRLENPGPIHAAIGEATTSGPYGDYPAGPLSAENTPGPTWHAPATLGPKRAAAFTHVHMLVFHPRDASAASLQSMLDAGWSTTDIVTISQLVSFLAFQIRTIAGLRVLEASL
jgi:CMD domain protein